MFITDKTEQSPPALPDKWSVSGVPWNDTHAASTWEVCLYSNLYTHKLANGAWRESEYFQTIPRWIMITSSIIHTLINRGVGLWQISLSLDRLWANMVSNSSRKSRVQCRKDRSIKTGSTKSRSAQSSSLWNCCQWIQLNLFWVWYRNRTSSVTERIH